MSTGELVSREIDYYFNYDVVKTYFKNTNWESLSTTEKRRKLLYYCERIFLEFRDKVCIRQMYDYIHYILMHDYYYWFTDVRNKLEVWLYVLKKYNANWYELNESVVCYYDNFTIRDPIERMEILFEKICRDYAEYVDRKIMINILRLYCKRMYVEEYKLNVIDFANDCNKILSFVRI